MELTIGGALARAADLFGDSTAVAEPGGPRLTYSELYERTLDMSRALIAMNVQPGDRVAIWSPNTTQWIIAALGTFCAGAVLVPVNTRFTGHEALDVIGRSRARALFVADWFLGRNRLDELLAAIRDSHAGSNELATAVTIPVEPARFSRAEIWAHAAIPLVTFEDLMARADDLAPRTALRRAATVKPDQVSDILFTSGTTGRSKGAMSSHAQALAVASAWAECGEVTSSDRYLVINPFFHSFGYKAGILVCLLTGAAIVPQLVYDPVLAMQVIEAERITVLPGAPTIYQTILDHPDRGRYDLSSLRLAVTGAATVPVALVERMQAELSFDTVLTAYGLTEAVVATMCRPGDDPKLVARTSGRATAGFEVRIEDGTGEILLRGPNVMLGYLDDVQATAEAIDPGGWLHTGDVGQLDENGYLTITDRLKDMYICGGFNVYPAEVEQVLARIDGIAESAVIGVPDERLGEVGKAFVVARPGSELAEAEVLAFCREQLANYKVPRQVEFRSQLPRNPSGKTLKRVLREESG